MTNPTTSGVTDFSRSAYQIINRALRQINAIADDEVPAPALSNNAMQALNDMVKGWQAMGIRVWAQEEAILFLQTGQTQYKLGTGSPDYACLYNDMTQLTLSANAAAAATTISVTSATGITSGAYIGIQLANATNFWTTVSGAPVGTTITLASGLPSAAASGAYAFSYVSPLPRPLRVPAGRRYTYSSKITTPMIVLSRLDYDYLPNLYNTGVVTQFFFDPQTGNGVYTNPIALMNLWPTPQDNTNALRFVAQRPLQTFSTLADIPDFPAEWTAAMTWNLALELSVEYDVTADRIQRVQERAGSWLAICREWDKEPESVLFGVAWQPGYRT